MAHGCSNEFATLKELPFELASRLSFLLLRKNSQGVENNLNEELLLTEMLLQSPCDVAQQMDVSLDDVNSICQYFGGLLVRRTNSLLAPVVVADILSNNCSRVLPTGHECLDSALKGGVSCGSITEITGATGSGKTALALHFALHSATNTQNDSQRAGTLWITSDASAFPALAAAEVLKCHAEAHCSGGEKKDNIEDALRAVSVVVCTTLIDLRNFISALRRHILRQPNVRLVVLDNFSTLVRRCFPGVDDEVAERHEAVTELMSIFKAIAQEFSVAVVITTLSGTELGHSFLHAMNTRFRLTQSLLVRRCPGGDDKTNGARATHILELVKSSAAAFLRFECLFDGLSLMRVQPLENDEIILREDAAFLGVNYLDCFSVPTFVYV